MKKYPMFDVEVRVPWCVPPSGRRKPYTQNIAKSQMSLLADDLWGYPGEVRKFKVGENTYYYITVTHEAIVVKNREFVFAHSAAGMGIESVLTEIYILSDGNLVPGTYKINEEDGKPWKHTVTQEQIDAFKRGMLTTIDEVNQVIVERMVRCAARENAA